MDLGYKEANMFKKLFAFLLIPAMAIGVFIGCGKKHTLLDVESYYNNMVDKYSYSVSGESNVEKRSYIFAQRSTDGKVPGTSMKITYKGGLGEGIESIGSLYSTSVEYDNKLYNRYYALVNVEQKLLDWTYNYYTSWADNLYDSYALIKHDIKQDDVEKLYKKVKKLDEKIEEFVKAKDQVEDEINAITFEGAIDLTSFTYAFNDIIEASFDFVNAFKDFHVKYIWNTYTFGENKETNKSLLDRLIDEAYLNMAQVIYYENVKAFEYLECDLNQLIEYAKDDYKDYVIAGLLFKDKVKLSPEGDVDVSVYKNGKLYSANDVNLDVSETYNSKLEQYLYYLKSYNQKISIYKDVYTKLNFYKYNQIRLGDGTMNLEDYKSTLSRVDVANLSLVENFATVTFISYVNEFVKIFQ